MEEELLDWELVHGSDTESTDSHASDKNSVSSRVIDEGVILSHHFSVDSLIDLPDQILESDDSSRVDHGSPNPGFSQLDVYESGDASVRNELGLSDGEVRVSDSGPSRDADDETHVTECLSETKHLDVGDGRRHVESQSGVEEPMEDSSMSGSGIVNGQEEIVSDTVDSAVRSGDGSKSKETVWWKMPLVLVKYYAFKIGPVWSVSMAAALMGFLLLGRRLYNTRKKPQKIHLNVAIDYKKVSRVMNQAARLNEMFTEVRRVPVIRAALPAPGAWPVLSLR